jgi:hypothetical protein
MMSGKPAIKAGLIGAVVILVMTLLSQIPGVGCFCCPPTVLAYAAIGALAGFFLLPPRTAGTGASAGAIAGLISGAVGGLIWIVALAVQMAIVGTGDIMSTLDPEVIRQLAELGIDPDTLAVFSGVGGVALGGGMCCLAGLAAGAGFGAAGGAIFAAIKPE